MKLHARALLVSLLLAVSGSASASTAQNDVRMCFYPSAVNSPSELVADLKWRATCVWNSLVTM
jgi:hypothetical protein